MEAFAGGAFESPDNFSRLISNGQNDGRFLFSSFLFQLVPVRTRCIVAVFLQLFLCLPSFLLLR